MCIELRFTSTEDYTLAYLDFVDIKKTKDQYEGPTLPMTLLISGTGSFSKPFVLNQQDPLVKSISYFFSDIRVSSSLLINNFLDVGHVHCKLKQQATSNITFELQLPNQMETIQSH